ncbi:MAG TPA: hypothetical protein VK483_17335 [Chitinophagaceae bacterium]|nr:hypothetical protein [Chitinophagaceae bacterium]
MRKFLLTVLICSVVFSQPLKAQNYYYYNSKYYDNPVVFEIGGTFGIMNSLTDLGGKRGVGKKFIKDLRIKTIRPSYGLYLMAMYNNVLGVRLEGTFGQVVGYDSILKSVASSTYGRYERNLSFKSKISEFQLGVEVHPLFFKSYEDEEPPAISPYIVVGASVYSFDPQAKLNGQWYSLQPLHTEGQGFAEYPDRKTYQLTQINFIAGFGVKYEINSVFNARLEFVHRFLTTDYLDDASQVDYIDPTLFYNYLTANQAAIAQQLYNRTNELNPGDLTFFENIQRGNPKDKDSYFTIELKVGFMLGRQRR